VLGGARSSVGMPSFKKILSEKEVAAIRSYIVARAQESASEKQTSLAGVPKRGIAAKIRPAPFLTRSYTRPMRHLVDIGAFAEKEVIQ